MCNFTIFSLARICIRAWFVQYQVNSRICYPAWSQSAGSIASISSRLITADDMDETTSLWEGFAEAYNAAKRNPGGPTFEQYAGSQGLAMRWAELMRQK